MYIHIHIHIHNIYIYIYIYIYTYGNFSFFVVHDSSWFPRGSRAKSQKQNRSRNGQKRVVFRNFFDKSGALDPNINISISKYAPECKKYRKNGPKISIYFSDIQPPLYIFLLFKQMRNCHMYIFLKYLVGVIPITLSRTLSPPLNSTLRELSSST